MLQFVASLFGCTHHHCTFPMTSRVRRATQAGAQSAGKPSPNTYVVCLDCGKEFAYDWQKMKKIAAARVA